MTKKFLTVLFFIATSFAGHAAEKEGDVYSLAVSRRQDFRLGVYITAHSVRDYLSSPEGRREALSVLRCNGVTKTYIEVYRSGLTIPPNQLKSVRDFFLQNGFEVVGGIATVPGGDFGVRQEAKLGWFNWQNKKTQDDLKKVIEQSAPLFDEFIVDDFMCTADTSDESTLAKGDKTWAEYRRDLFVKLSRDIFIDPAKRANPTIKLTIKFPQWYDRFHLFGYDPVRESALFDQIWIGTETRGQYTQRYGFVQPYEAFVNFRWLADIGGDKTGGAWFDHGDCDALDFIEQAYQSVLAGASELVLFHYGDLVNGHPGHHLLRKEFEHLADLAHIVHEHPVRGIPGYKPANSDAGGDLYIMDYIGMIGVPLIPVATFPKDAETIFLPTQAAHDADVVEKTLLSIGRGATIIMTSGFLLHAKDGEKLAAAAGIKFESARLPLQADSILVGDSFQSISRKLEMEAVLTLMPGTKALLTAKSAAGQIPYLTQNVAADIYVLNTHTFSQSDFDAVGEVLLCPKQLGVLDLPESSANTIRSAFYQNVAISLQAPMRVTFQPLGDKMWMLHNYNQHKVDISIDSAFSSLLEQFSQKIYNANSNGQFCITMTPRSRILLQASE